MSIQLRSEVCVGCFFGVRFTYNSKDMLIVDFCILEFVIYVHHARMFNVRGFLSVNGFQNGDQIQSMCAR